MSHVRGIALICACALLYIDVIAAPPRRSQNKESNVLQEKTIAVRRMPLAYSYPFSLWPVLRYPNRDKEDAEYKYRQRRSIQKYRLKQSRR